MESFINTDTITDDEELLEALKHNNKVSSSMKQEIKEIEKLDEANKNMTFKKEKQRFEENDEYDEGLDEDMDYLYYYEPIKEIREDINVMLHSMDVFVFPSIFEGLGLVLLEAQAAGLPCIVSEAIQPEADLGLNLFTNLKLA